MEVFKIQDLTYYYPRKEMPDLENINLSIKQGEFILVLGASGSGKSTLGRIFNGIVPKFTGGKIKGKIEGKTEVGMVFQDPEKQLVMDGVEREIAFGLENIGMEHNHMRKCVMETLSFFNMWNMKDTKTYKLSGGQKQKVALASCVAMGYKFLVLDEPTSQLDPVTSEDMLHIIKRLNEDLGYTIILIEQRIDRCFHLADRVLYMDKGHILFDGKPKEFVKWNYEHHKNYAPSVADYFNHMGQKHIPLTIKDGREELEKIQNSLNHEYNPNQETCFAKEDRVRIHKVYYTYPQGKEVLKDVHMNIKKGEIVGLMGENGCGKSTLLKNIAGLLSPDQGKIFAPGKIGYLSQNPNDYLFNDTVYQEIQYTLDQNGIVDKGQIKSVCKELEIYDWINQNPRDLSGGQRQRVALASILVMDPDLLILDEPTRGLDRRLKEKLGRIILQQQRKGKSILCVTHDVEFVSKYCNRVALMFDGNIVQMGSSYEVLTQGIYYTTQMNKLFRGFSDYILTVEDAIKVSKCIS